MLIQKSDEVRDALELGDPVVALESTVISHGLPYPENLETANSLERAVRDGGATPATIAILEGELWAGIDNGQLQRLATGEDIRKVSVRDLAIVTARKLHGATTVATTSMIAHRAGIEVFSTGGIGGVHRGDGADVSADLPVLACTPIIVVCSGAKSVLDLPRTREWLETWGVTVLGWQCDEMPAFYSRTSGLDVDESVETSEEVAAICAARRSLGIEAALLVAVPVPKEDEIPREEAEEHLAASLREAGEKGITGKDVTPFLLRRLAELSEGRTLAANLALLKHNAGVAAGIAAAIAKT